MWSYSQWRYGECDASRDSNDASYEIFSSSWKQNHSETHLKKDLWFSLPDILNTTGLVLLTFTDNCNTDDCCHGVNGV